MLRVRRLIIPPDPRLQADKLTIVIAAKLLRQYIAPAQRLSNNIETLPTPRVADRLDRDTCSGSLQDSPDPNDHVDYDMENSSSSTQSPSVLDTPVVSNLRIDLITPCSYGQECYGVYLPVDPSTEAAPIQQWSPTNVPVSTYNALAATTTSYDAPSFFATQVPHDPPSSPTSMFYQRKSPYLENLLSSGNPVPQQSLIFQEPFGVTGVPISPRFDDLEPNIPYTCCAPIPFCGLCTECLRRL
jgi:hypothetical protein